MSALLDLRMGESGTGWPRDDVIHCFGATSSRKTRARKCLRRSVLLARIQLCSRTLLFRQCNVCRFPWRPSGTYAN